MAAVLRHDVLEVYGEMAVKFHTVPTLAVLILVVSSSLRSLHPPVPIVYKPGIHRRSGRGTEPWSPNL
jgi:hypothetical protein